MIKKIIFLSFAFFGMSLMALYTANVGKNQKPKINLKHGDSFVVLELFTSQGCSSCPPADTLLERVQKEFPKSVFALSYHVDYWDYIGWKDPFAKSAYTKKQSAYNRKFRSPNNYTPQIVVNGKEHFVGSNSTTAHTKIKFYSSKNTDYGIKLESVNATDDQINFEYSTIGDINHKLLRAVLVIDERTTQVKRGENRNRTLRNTNIVVAEQYIDLERQSGTASINIPDLVSPTDDLTLVLVMESENLDIIAATKTAINN